MLIIIVQKPSKSAVISDMLKGTCKTALIIPAQIKPLAAKENGVKNIERRVIK